MSVKKAKTRYVVSTTTFYFETYVFEQKLVSVLKECLDSGELGYYRYLTYNFYGAGNKCIKIIGVVQMSKRCAKVGVRRMFQDRSIYMDLIQPSLRPNVLSFMKMYVLGERHGIDWSESKSSETLFSFGGRKQINKEMKRMKPYIKALQLYKDYDEDEFHYKYLPGARIICKFKYKVMHSLMNI
jgi:hypothetical protein